MGMIKKNQEQDHDILCWILGVNIRAHKRKKQLEKRLLEIKAEENMPIGGQGYDPLPRGSSIGPGAAGIILKLDEIEERILKQKASIQRAIIQVMDILEYLPEDSTERSICELRYIDRMSMEAVADEVGLSRSGCYKVSQYQRTEPEHNTWCELRRSCEQWRDLRVRVCAHAQRPVGYACVYRLPPLLLSSINRIESVGNSICSAR